VAKFRRVTSADAKDIRFALGIDDYSAKAGWFESAKYEDGTPVASVAIKQEFGAMPIIPPRSFMRTAAAENKDNWASVISELSKEMVKGNISPENVMLGFGSIVAGDIRKKIASITDPPLADSTIKNRTSKRANNKKVGNLTKPLVDSALMINTLTNIAEKS